MSRSGESGKAAESRHKRPGPRGVLLLGADGMLGRAMHAALNARGWHVEAPSLAQFDLSDPRSFERAKRWREWVGIGALIINCAAWTDVDGAEKNEPLATAVNGEAVLGLLELGALWDATLVTFSTDYVFDGNGTGPYAVGAPRSPLNAYGRSKAAGEEVLEASVREWLNIRTSWLYAPWGRNFVLTIRDLLFEKPLVKVVDDQRGRPTSAEHLARTTLALIDRGEWRHWHVTDGGECSWYEFAKEIARLTGAPGRVEPCTSAEFPRPAKRPAYSVLDISKTEALIGAMPRWQDNLADVVRRIPG